MEISNMARVAEKENNWREAERLWNICGHKSDADACKLIADSISKGDAFRDEVLQKIGEEPVLHWNNSLAWNFWYSVMSDIYRKHYK